MTQFVYSVLLMTSIGIDLLVRSVKAKGVLLYSQSALLFKPGNKYAAVTIVLINVIN